MFVERAVDFLDGTRHTFCTLPVTLGVALAPPGSGELVLFGPSGGERVLPKWFGGMMESFSD